MSYTNRTFTWDFDALKRFYERYIVKWINSAVSWTEAQKTQARANLGLGDGSIDSEPTFGSNNIVTSGGVSDSVFEVSTVALDTKTENKFFTIGGTETDTDVSDIYLYSIGGSAVLYICMPQWILPQDTTVNPIAFIDSSGDYVGRVEIDLSNEKQHVFCVSPDDAAQLVISNPKTGFTPVVKAVKFDLDGLAKFNRGIISPSVIDNNKFVSYNTGNISASTNSYAATYPVSSGNILCVDAVDTAANAAVVSFYSGTPGMATYMKDFSIQGGGTTGKRKLLVAVPRGAQYMLLTGKISNKATNGVSYIESIEIEKYLLNLPSYVQLGTALQTLEETVEAISGSIDAYIRTEGVETNYAESDLLGGWYRTHKPEGIDIGSSYDPVRIAPDSTDYKSLKLEVKQGDVITICTSTSTNSSARAYILTDAEHVITEWSVAAADLTTPVTIDIQSDGYLYVNMIVAAMSGHTFSVDVVRQVESGKMVELEEDVQELQELVVPDDSNPLSIIRETAGLVPIIHKIGVIGASLSSGYINITTETEEDLTDYWKEYSWPQMMAHLCGITCYNFGQGGFFCKRWLDNVGGYYNEMAEAGKECDAYIIGFAVNDQGKADYPLGTIADINIGNEAANAASYYGYFSKVIARCHSVMPRAYLFLQTNNYKKETLEGYYQAQRDICDAYRSAGYNIYMIDCAQYGKSFTELTQNGMARSAHCVPSGYLYMAYEVCTYIDWIIRHNMDDFMDIAFVRKAVEYDPSGTPINP